MALPCGATQGFYGNPFQTLVMSIKNKRANIPSSLAKKKQKTRMPPTWGNLLHPPHLT